MGEIRHKAGEAEAEQSGPRQRDEAELEFLDREIEKLRGDIRWQISHIRELAAKGYPRHMPVLVLRLLFRTLEVERRYRKLLADRVAPH